MTTEEIRTQIDTWLNEVVIGLNLCPFAAKPQRNNQIKIVVSEANNEETLLQSILEHFLELESLPAHELETTIIAAPFMLQDFTDYNFFLDWVDALLKQQQWEGIFQVATFHPDYCFHGAAPDDDENLTNRAPFPLFHLIREESMARVLQHYPDPESIPDNNIARVSALTFEQRQKLFPYLFTL